ncbi:hypothetical protein [Chryseobacterium sp. T1]
MRNSVTFLILILLLMSCSKNSESRNIESNTNTEETQIEKLNIQTKNFIEIDSTGILMFPLEMSENKNRDKSYSYKEMPNNGFWNILFLNSSTNDYHLLTDKKILIVEYDYKYGREDGVKFSKNLPYIFYNVRTNDYNKDKLLNEKDPVYLFISDKAGKNFRQISPDNYSVNSWKYIALNNKVVMTASKDSNNNNLFDEKDELSTFEVILG